MTKRQICVQIDEEIAQRMEEIREKTFGHLFDDEERLAEVQNRWSEAFGTKTALEILHRKKE